MSDYRYSAYCLFIGDDDGDLDRYRCDAGIDVHARRDKTGYRQHMFVAVIVCDARNVRIDGVCGSGTMMRKMRMHLPRVVMSRFVVVEMDVRHRSGDGAYLDSDCQDGCKTTVQHIAIL